MKEASCSFRPGFVRQQGCACPPFAPRWGFRNPVTLRECVRVPGSVRQGIQVPFRHYANGSALRSEGRLTGVWPGQAPFSLFLPVLPVLRVLLFLPVPACSCLFLEEAQLLR
ncbi:hypothetical protein [Streptomyces phaeochromogenes]|uniref:hypothetical protein n=1 Tax=Streptomyces phaeochromogenes TaxID=1923 RepID=UPI0036ABEF0E